MKNAALCLCLLVAALAAGGSGTPLMGLALQNAVGGLTASAGNVLGSVAASTDEEGGEGAVEQSGRDCTTSRRRKARLPSQDVISSGSEESGAASQAAAAKETLNQVLDILNHDLGGLPLGADGLPLSPEALNASIGFLPLNNITGLPLSPGDIVKCIKGIVPLNFGYKK